MTNLIKNFSTKYWMVDADLVPFGGGEVTVSHQMGERLLDFSPQPTLKIGKCHYRVQTEGSIPSDTIAVPEGELDDPDQTPLLAKGFTLQELLSGESEVE